VQVAILTDIHSNLPALEAVLEAISATKVDETWCLGDVVGYGAQPDQCTELVAEKCDLSLVGNHDLAVLGEIDLDVFSAAAASAVSWTQTNCGPKTIEYLRGLKPEETDREVALYHASPRDPVWEYVLAVDQAADCMKEQAKRVSLIGHSHVALFFADGGGDDEQVTGGQAEGGRKLDISAGRWLLNPGSVGQPRDGDRRAAWLELDTDDWTATYHRVDYEIDRAAEAIRAAGLPELLADRLYAGQ
jgi:diadenosine tetraphosphatase ApaH/serine/threonine PP2A family protein phosphatase